MWESLGECSSYIVGKAMVIIPLPEKKPVCQYCPQIRYQQAYDRHHCGLTSEWLMDYKRERGRECPLIFNIEGLEKE